MGIVDEFQALKAETDADLLAMQVGDFYEFFAADARTVASVLDLQVSEKSNHGSSYPMAGVPVDDLTPYLAALVERGYRVAVAEQSETDAGDIEREIERVVTPGTLLASTDADPRYLAAVVREAGGDWGLAFVDVTTGQFRVTRGADRADAVTELYRFAPAEVLPGPALRGDDEFLGVLRERTDATLTLHDAGAFDAGRATHRVREQFGDGVIESLGVAADGPVVRAAGAAVGYIAAADEGVLASVSRIQPFGGGDHVELDATTQRNLELTETMTGGSDGSLLATIDHTASAAGGRRLAAWVTRPTRDRAELDRRQAAVGALADAALARDALGDVLGEIYDLERLASRAASGRADATDLLRVRDTLAALPDVADALTTTPELAESPARDVLARVDRAAAADVRAELADALADDPPKTLSEGGLLQAGYDEALDELLAAHDEHRAWLDGLADREKDRLGVTHLQVDRNKTDGYYIQVGNSETDAVPDGEDGAYRRIKQLKNATRYTTAELDSHEREVLRIEAERAELERELFAALRERVGERAAVLQDVGRALAEVDALVSLAEHAAANQWVRPELVAGDGLDIDAGRHPVVEQTTSFVPNDARFDASRRFQVVTGPNMSGKSTYMRQVAVIVLLAQVGSFVPADAARIGLVDGIYTRVGALDELAGGRSTFMVEMEELSRILHAATSDSLVVLDEVGRGTATYDGISIAWAATEYLHNEVRATTLFATHYHELTALADHLDAVVNVHVAAEERDGAVTFLRTVRDGATDRSYGVHVAALAGVPEPVVDRARGVLDRLREENAVEAKGSAGESVQAVFDVDSGGFVDDAGDDGEADDPEAAAVLDELRTVELAETSPVELLGTVQAWQDRLED
ncbi:MULTISPECIES: DNA mismatch repair protein MutS [Halobacterium]|nr:MULTISPECIES: DNA mismatch repair protein MutS [Halobacterium]MCF2166089.1 DNA mismatch repair protein MutS [Halobacterium salinarum]MCF2166817.1 DNA mismatch repair protein MutS [Halobacterium salinarum]QRY22843.1 DNA mismatch repair protein MutS [Halobacterium sp. GSL-19]QRY24936.1 DNA mismatch repair protein MutS [Halobacterium sp. BOL4-2]WJK64144.1 DNA mismatch repair protein MutS [Halobacterium salinarum]